MDISEVLALSFPSISDVDIAIDSLNTLIEKYGYATLADWCDICNSVSDINFYKYRWTQKINYRVIHDINNGCYIIDFIDQPECYDDPKSLANNTDVKNDSVNHPAHYTAGGIECIDAIAAALTSQNDPMSAWLTGSCFKYLWRWPLKNGVEDLKKARFYLDRLIKHEEEK